MKKFYKSQQDPNPSRRVNPSLEKGYPARRVDPGWLLRSCKYLLQVDRRRVDPLRQVEANPGSCKGGLRLKSSCKCNLTSQSGLSHHRRLFTKQNCKLLLSQQLVHSLQVVYEAKLQVVIITAACSQSENWKPTLLFSKPKESL